MRKRKNMRVIAYYASLISVFVIFSCTKQKITRERIEWSNFRWEQEDVRPEHRFLRVKGGFLKGSVYQAENKSWLKLQHCDVDGNVVHEELFSKQ